MTVHAGCCEPGCLSPATHVEYGAIVGEPDGSVGEGVLFTCAQHADLNAVSFDVPSADDAEERTAAWLFEWRYPGASFADSSSQSDWRRVARLVLKAGLGLGRIPADSTGSER